MKNFNPPCDFPANFGLKIWQHIDFTIINSKKGSRELLKSTYTHEVKTHSCILYLKKLPNSLKTKKGKDYGKLPFWVVGKRWENAGSFKW